MTVIPVCNVDEADEAGLVGRIEAVRGHAPRVHLDVSDGTFAPTRTFRDARRVKELLAGMRVQAHLMVSRPEDILEDWIDAGADEVVVHLEPLVAGQDGEPAVARLARMRDACLARGAHLLLAGGPALETRALLAYRAYADGFLVLAVEPGPPGQRMQAGMLDVVRVIRDTFPDDPVWVDGGVNRETVGIVREAGATGAVSGAIFREDDPVAALAALQ